MPEQHPSKPLRALLIERGALIDREEEVLSQPDVVALAPEQQLAFLATNRRVGFYVTAIAGGLRVLLVAGGALAHVGLTLSGRVPFGWWSPIIWVALTILLAWLIPTFVRRVAARARPLPTWDELGTSTERGPRGTDGAS